MTRTATATLTLLAALTVAFVWSAQSCAAPGGSARPIKGIAEGRVVAQPAPNHLVIEYTGRASHLGKFTRTEDLFLNLDGTVTGTILFIAANGDQLRLTFAGHFTSTNDVEGTYTFTGGTGRFTAASGTATFKAFTPDFINVEATFEGTISY
jgi:hypothetical protein